MKTQEEIEARITELEGIGSPAALSKASELRLVLGIEESNEGQDADMLTDILLAGRDLTEPESLEDQLPDFVADHVLLAFSPKYKELARLRAIAIKHGYGTLTPDEKKRYTELQEELGNKASKFWQSLPKKDRDEGLEEMASTDATYTYSRVPDLEESLDKATLIASKTKKGKHRPLLDLDMKVAVIPSSTPGHGHLYIDKELTWTQYKKLLKVLAELDIIEKGYRGASIARGYTALRLPWVKKTAEEMEESREKRARALNN